MVWRRWMEKERERGRERERERRERDRARYICYLVIYLFICKFMYLCVGCASMCNVKHILARWQVKICRHVVLCVLFVWWNLEILDALATFPVISGGSAIVLCDGIFVGRWGQNISSWLIRINHYKSSFIFFFVFQVPILQKAGRGLAAEDAAADHHNDLQRRLRAGHCAAGVDGGWSLTRAAVEDYGRVAHQDLWSVLDFMYCIVNYN